MKMSELGKFDPWDHHFNMIIGPCLTARGYRLEPSLMLTS